MPFPTPYSPETRSTAIELLEQARDDGMNQHQAAINVAALFEKGPAVSTLHTWAKEAKIFPSTRVSAAKKDTSSTPAAPIQQAKADSREVVTVLKQENQALRDQVAGQKKEINALRGLVGLYVRPVD